jgi:hypothetical protein
MKLLFEYFTESFSLLENPTDDYVIMVFIGIIAYVIAYILVGELYRNNLIAGRGAGHYLHWFIRLIVFMVLFYIAAIVIRVYTWFQSLPAYTWMIIMGVLIGVSALITVIKLIINSRGSMIKF